VLNYLWWYSCQSVCIYNNSLFSAWTFNTGFISLPHSLSYIKIYLNSLLLWPRYSWLICYVLFPNLCLTFDCWAVFCQSLHFSTFKNTINSFSSLRVVLLPVSVHPLVPREIPNWNYSVSILDSYCMFIPILTYFPVWK
jgi:hypothetical protein